VADIAVGSRARPRPRREWLRVFLVGLLLWVATVVTTFWTANANLVPTVILLGSFLVPATFVVYVLERHADQVLTGQRIFTAFLYGGVLGVLGASILEAEFLKEPSIATYIGVGLIEEAAKLAALWAIAWRLPRYTMRDGILLGGVVGLGFAALENVVSFPWGAVWHDLASCLPSLRSSSRTSCGRSSSPSCRLPLGPGGVAVGAPSPTATALPRSCTWPVPPPRGGSCQLASLVAAHGPRSGVA
jgi:hypothetical protein